MAFLPGLTLAFIFNCLDGTKRASLTSWWLDAGSGLDTCLHVALDPGGLPILQGYSINVACLFSRIAWTSLYGCWRKKRLPTPVFLPGNPMDRGAWQATVHGDVKSWTWRSTHIHTFLPRHKVEAISSIKAWIQKSKNITSITFYWSIKS